MGASAMTVYPIAIYANGLFQDGFPTPSVPYTNQAAQLAQGITTVILWSIHVYPNGDLYLNDTKFVSGGQIQFAADGKSGVNPEFPELIGQLFESTSSVRELHISVGGWNATKDFTDWCAAMDAVGANLSALKSVFGVSAVDFDFEPEDGYGAQDQAMIVALTLQCGQLGLGVTYCPYTDEDFWIGCLTQVYAQNSQKQVVIRFNLQCYAGGAGNDPQAWGQQLQQATGTGVTDPYAFILPGFEVLGAPEEPQSPSGMQQTFAGLAGTGVVGGFLWNSGFIWQTEVANGGVPTPAEYASAITAGLTTTG